MDAGHALLELAGDAGAGTIFVVGTAKNAGKTVTLRAIYRAALASRTPAALASVGRDGELLDAVDARQKPRFWLEPGTVVASAATVLPPSPSSAILDDPQLDTPAGPLVYARVRCACEYELIGPPTASGVRRMVAGLQQMAELTLVDGAVDRIAAVAGEPGAIVVAAGIGDAHTPDEAADLAAGLVARLTLKAWNPDEPFLRVDGALTADRVATLLSARETRQVVVRDPTRLALSGTAATTALTRLRIRCERPLRVIGVTVAPSDGRRGFEPRRFLRAVSAATGLPAFDPYAGSCAA
jgi:hypothetical protein